MTVPAPADFTRHKHPVLAVPCPECGARTGAWCRRPSGHKASSFHRSRNLAADREWLRQGAPFLMTSSDGTRIIVPTAKLDAGHKRQLAASKRAARKDLQKAAARRRPATARQERTR